MKAKIYAQVIIFGWLVVDINESRHDIDMLSYSMAFGGGRLLDELTARNATNFSVNAE